MKVFITGGTGGIGEACISTFAKAGYQVLFSYCKQEMKAKEIAEKYNATPVFLDLSDNTTIEQCAEKIGDIDILVNNAGISAIGLFQDFSAVDIGNILQTNLAGSMYLTNRLLPKMIEKKKGCILNVGSVWGRVGASCEVTYSATKAGLRGFTMALAKEVGPSGIRVNCIEPGVIDTAMNRHFDAETMKELAEETPLCRIGKPEDVANLALFLASDNASFITGQCIGVDGGFGL